MVSHMKKYFSLNPFRITILTIILGITAYFYEVPFLDLMELKTIDLRFQARGSIAPNPEVVLAVLDEKSINKEGKWIWPRSKIATLVDKISQAGARVMAFDIGFLEPDDKQIVLALNKVQNKLVDYSIHNKKIFHYLEDLKTKSDNDQLLADAIENSKCKVVLGYFFHMNPEETKHMDENEINFNEENISGGKYKYVRYESKQALNVPLFNAIAPQANIRVISESTDLAGFFNMFPEQDGVVRRLPAVMKFKNSLYAPLSFITVSAYLDKPLSINIANHGVESINIGEYNIPTDEIGHALINYRGPTKTFPHISITDILNENIDPDVLKDKIVMIGATAIGIFDLRVTPFSSVFPGLEIHANMVDTILSKKFLHQPAWAALFDIMAILTTGLCIWLVLHRIGAISGAIAALLMFGIYIVLCQYMFAENGWILNLVYPLVVITFVYTNVTGYKYLVESRQKRFIKDAFSTYLAPAVVKHLMDSPEKLDLGGEERIITAFFSDVQGFTSISEKLTATELVELLNEFLTEMTNIILEHEGTVDKFEGDAIIALFGAPNTLNNQAEVACKTCIDMQNKLVELREKWKVEGKPALKMRIGLCTGHAVVGNMGSKTRMDYTMMGDTVNIAARLEGVNKVYGTYTMVSDSTYEAMIRDTEHQATDNRIISREIDSINVVGKNEPVRVYQLVGYKSDVDSNILETISSYTDGLEAYRQQDWNSAIIHFNKSLSFSPDESPSKTMLVRCNEFKATPPGKTWDGTYTMRTK